MEACQTDSVRTITGCIVQGANLELADKQGRRAIHEASRTGQLKALIALSAFGADFKAVRRKCIFF